MGGKGELYCLASTLFSSNKFKTYSPTCIQSKPYSFASIFISLLLRYLQFLKNNFQPDDYEIEVARNLSIKSTSLPL